MPVLLSGQNSTLNNLLASFQERCGMGFEISVERSLVQRGQCVADELLDEIPSLNIFIVLAEKVSTHWRHTELNGHNSHFLSHLQDTFTLFGTNLTFEVRVVEHDDGDFGLGELSEPRRLPIFTTFDHVRVE